LQHKIYGLFRKVAGNLAIGHRPALSSGYIPDDLRIVVAVAELLEVPDAVDKVTGSGGIVSYIKVHSGIGRNQYELICNQISQPTVTGINNSRLGLTSEESPIRTPAATA